MAEAIMRGHYRGWREDDASRSGVSFEDFMKLLAAGQEDMKYKITASVAVNPDGFDDLAEAWVDPRKPVTLVLSDRVGPVAGQRAKPEEGIHGFGIRYVVDSDGSLLAEVTFPENFIEGSPVNSKVVSWQACLPVVYALRDLGLPDWQQTWQRPVENSTLDVEKIDGLLRSVADGMQPLVWMVEPVK
jgi:hypothetical protein